MADHRRQGLEVAEADKHLRAIVGTCSWTSQRLPRKSDRVQQTHLKLLRRYQHRLRSLCQRAISATSRTRPPIAEHASLPNGLLASRAIGSQRVEEPLAVGRRQHLREETCLRLRYPPKTQLLLPRQLLFKMPRPSQLQKLQPRSQRIQNLLFRKAQSRTTKTGTTPLTALDHA